MAEFDLVIFDCDGVLVDSEVLSARVLVAELGKVGVEVDEAFVFRHFVGHSFTQVFTITEKHFGVVLPADFADHYYHGVLTAFGVDLRIMPGVASVLDRLTVQTCVATSSSPRRVAQSLRLTGLQRFFEGRVFTASEVERGKPAPDLFLHAADRLGVSATRCLVIEDSVPGVEGAQAAGMTVLRFVGGAQFRHPLGPATDDLAGVTTFDTWTAFGALAPSVLRPGISVA